MSDDSNDPHHCATDPDFKLPQTQQIQPVGVQADPEADDNPDPVPPAPAKKRRQFRLKSLLQFRLWLLLLLFVPVAWYFKDYANRPSITYIEEKDLFWKDGMTELDFLKKPDGSPLARQQNVDSAFQDIGVTFTKGLPFRNPESETAPGLVRANHLKSKREKEKEKQPAQPAKKANQPKASEDSPSSRQKNLKATIHPKAGSTGSGYIGISGYPFMFPEARYKNSICVFDTAGNFSKRFKGSITIRFHKPKKPNRIAGVHAIGFFAARLNHAEALEVRAYNLDGELLCRQKNIAKPCAFMSLKSKNTPISRIEIETIGTDPDYAITGLMFDKVRSYPIRSAIP